MIAPGIQLPDNHAHIFDGMVLLQQLQQIPLATMGDVSDHVLKTILSNGQEFIYFVTDQYLEHSIKSYERAKRKQEGTIR